MKRNRHNLKVGQRVVINTPLYTNDSKDPKDDLASGQIGTVTASDQGLIVVLECGGWINPADFGTSEITVKSEVGND